MDTKKINDIKVIDPEEIRNYEPKTNRLMKKYLIFYWRETGDDNDWFERIVEAPNIETALALFKDRNPLVKVESIELIVKTKFIIRQEIPRSVLENVFVTAIEGGSNYWYYLSKLAVKLIREAVPKEQEPYLAVAMLKAVLDHNVIVPINDAEDELEVVGHLSSETIQERLIKLYKDKELRWCLEAELSRNGDAETSDVVFQFLTMGEYTYA
jgi:hypothetical protein